MKNINDRKREEALIQLQQEAYTGIEKGYMLSSLLENVCRIIESFFKDGTTCTILFIDEIHMIIGAGSASGGRSARR